MKINYNQNIQDLRMNPFLSSLLGVFNSESRFSAYTTMRPPIKSVINSAMRTTINTSTQKIRNESAPIAEKLSDADIRRTNFIWPEDPADELPVK